MDVKTFFGKIYAGYRKHKPGIMTAACLASMLAGTIEAVRVTPEAMEAIEQKKEEEGHDRLTAAQTIQCCWKIYIRAATLELIGIGCGISALNENNKRIGSLLTVVNGLENGVRELQTYRQFVADKIGEKKEAEIYQQTIQEEVNRNPPPADMAAKRTVADGSAPVPMCYDIEFERYYYKSYEDVREAVNDLNNEITTGLNGYVSLNDFYSRIGVRTMAFGDRVGWSTETGLITIPDKDELQFAGTPDGWPCWVLEFKNPPQYEYQFFRRH